MSPKNYRRLWISPTVVGNRGGTGFERLVQAELFLSTYHIKPRIVSRRMPIEMVIQTLAQTARYSGRVAMLMASLGNSVQKVSKKNTVFRFKQGIEDALHRQET